HIGLIRGDQFRKKADRKLPQWMQEQIDEDFRPFLERGISKQQVDETFDTIRRNLPEPYYIRYRIIDNTLYRYFPKNELISLDDNDLEKTLKTLMHYFQLNAIDFIVGYIDGIPFPGTPPKFYHTTDEKLQAPLLVFARLNTTRHTVLIPDWRSIANWWVKDAKTVFSNLDLKPWDKKKNRAYWRGGLTKDSRLNACRISLHSPEILDIKLVGDELGTDLKQEGVVGEYTTLDQFMDYKYLPTFDGVVCAYPAFQWRLLSNSVTLKQESNETQWFYRAVKPYVHYIPIKNDLSDLYDQVRWAHAHDLECREIAKKSTDFALNNLMIEDNYTYLYHVLLKYASLQNLDRQELKREMLVDDRWVNIQ
ncbi:MAG: glycosyl transferase family 90, partial [Rhabdochlamydiaceae bacterium]